MGEDEFVFVETHMGFLWVKKRWCSSVQRGALRLRKNYFLSIMSVFWMGSAGSALVSSQKDGIPKLVSS